MAMKPLGFEPKRVTPTEDAYEIDCAGNDGCWARVGSENWEGHLTWHRNLWRTSAGYAQEAHSPLTSNP